MWGLTYLGDISKHVRVKSEVVFSDVKMALEQDVTNKGARVSCKIESGKNHNISIYHKVQDQLSKVDGDNYWKSIIEHGTYCD